MAKELNRKRLALLMNMVASSEHDGEALAAAKQACKMVKAAELSWDQVFAPPSGIGPIPWDELLRPKPQPRPYRPPPPPREPPKRDMPGVARDMYADVMASKMKMPERDLSFLMGIAPVLDNLSIKQMKWLADIHVRVCEYNTRRA